MLELLTMKQLLFPLTLLITCSVLSQNIQLHYDFRHSIDPGHHPRNFPTFSFEYFKNIDTVGTGSFLFKIQADLGGESSNVSQVFTQVSQSLRFWRPKVFLSLNYSGGLGVTPSSFGFHIANAYGVGISYPFQWRGAWLASNLQVRYNAFEKASIDPQFTFYFGRGFFDWRILVSGSLVFWTENNNRGTADTESFSGKKFAFFGDPQVWVKVRGNFSIGTRINLAYHIFSERNVVKLYPTVGGRYQFQGSQKAQKTQRKHR